MVFIVSLWVFIFFSTFSALLQSIVFSNMLLDRICWYNVELYVYNSCYIHTIQVICI